MKKKLTITVSEDVYNGLQLVVGSGKISQFLEALARPHVVPSSLEAGYQEAGQNEAQEAEALEWANTFLGDALDG